MHSDIYPVWTLSVNLSVWQLCVWIEQTTPMTHGELNLYPTSTNNFLRDIHRFLASLWTITAHLGFISQFFIAETMDPQKNVFMAEDLYRWLVRQRVQHAVICSRKPKKTGNSTSGPLFKPQIAPDAEVTFQIASIDPVITPYDFHSFSTFGSRSTRLQFAR